MKLPPYNAAGDGVTDDSAALQKAIDENEIVFLPKGYYCLQQTLRLKPNTKLIGVAHHLSILMTRSPFGKLQNAKDPQPLVDTADTAQADTYIAFVGIGVPYQAEARVPGDTVGMYALRWQCGGSSILRSPGIQRMNIFGHGSGLPKGYKMLTFDHPTALITGHGGGKWYNFFIHGGGHPETKTYRHILLSHNTEPIAFYQLHAQHASGDSQCEAVGVKDMTVFGIKTENNSSFMLLKDCDTVRLFGHGGIATSPPGGAQYTFRDVKNLLIACTSDQVNLEAEQSDQGRPDQAHKYQRHVPLCHHGRERRPAHAAAGAADSFYERRLPAERREVSERMNKNSLMLALLGGCLMPGMAAESLSTSASALQVVAVLHDESALAGAHDIEIRDGLAYVAGKGFTRRNLPGRRGVSLRGWQGRLARHRGRETARRSEAALVRERPAGLRRRGDGAAARWRSPARRHA